MFNGKKKDGGLRLRHTTTRKIDNPTDVQYLAKKT